jgi:hypothetical protein
MAKGFKLRGSKNPSDFNGLPPLPEDVDDNLYLASAAHAAVTDFKSGAYDEFLFSEHGMEQMPFEKSVDNHLDLVSLRLKDRGRRELLLKNQALLEAKAKLAQIRSSIETLQARLKSVKSKVADQQAILDGKVPGKHGLMWPGSAPELTSKRSARWALRSSALTFAIVGLIDIYIIILSLQSLDGFDGWEPYIFALPAVGVQLVFPHFIGERIRLMLHGHPRKFVNAIESTLLALGWVGFIWAMTQIRMEYIVKTVMEAGGTLSFTLRIALQAMIIVMLLALGTWLMLQTSRSNPHEREMSRLQLAEREATENLQAANERITGLEAEIPVLDLALRVAEESYRDSVLAVGKTLAETAKSVYRRALVNQTGSVDFTTAYMGDKSTLIHGLNEEPGPTVQKGE